LPVPLAGPPGRCRRNLKPRELVIRLGVMASPAALAAGIFPLFFSISTSTPSLSLLKLDAAAGKSKNFNGDWRFVLGDNPNFPK